MSTSASLDVNFTKPFDTLALIKALLKFGWTFNDHGKKTYLPVGDDGAYNWQMQDIPDKDLLKIIKQKIKTQEMVGVVMTWQNMNIGGSFQFYNRSLNIILDINRVKTAQGWTDVNAYLAKILPVFDDTGFKMSFWQFSEIK